MFETATPIAILQRQTALLRSHLPGLLDGRFDSIHDARITTRRLREVLPLTHEWQRRHVADDLATRFKRMGRSLGRVRDADVRIGLLRYLESRVPLAAPVLVTVRQGQETDRLQLMRKLVKRLERLAVEPELARLASGAEWRGGRFWVGLTGTWRVRLRRLVADRGYAAIGAIEHATGVYFPNRTHAARIAIKKFRYAAEIAAETGVLVDPALLRDLKKTQDVLGELHDRQTLLDELGTGAHSADDPDAAPVRLVVQVLQAEAEDRHRRFLERRAGLVDACARAQRAVQPIRPSMVALAAAGAVAFTALELLRRQRGGHGGASAVDVEPAQPEPEVNAAAPLQEPNVSVRIPVVLPDRATQPQ